MPFVSTIFSHAPLAQWPERLPVQEDAGDSTSPRGATHHAEIAQTVERRVESASVADSISALGARIKEGWQSGLLRLA